MQPPIPPPSLWPPSAPTQLSDRPAPVNEEQLAAALKFHWCFIKAELKENYVCLTDDDLNFAEGRELELLEHLERKTGHDRGEFSRFILRCAEIGLR